MACRVTSNLRRSTRVTAGACPTATLPPPRKTAPAITVASVAGIKNAETLTGSSANDDDAGYHHMRFAERPVPGIAVITRMSHRMLNPGLTLRVFAPGVVKYAPSSQWPSVPDDDLTGGS